MPSTTPLEVRDASPDEVVVDLLHAIDELDWPRVRAALGDKVTVDYTSLFGGEVETLGGDDLVARWRGLLPGFDATQHLLGPVLTRGDPEHLEVHAEAHVRAYHYLAGAEGGPVWMVAGHYRLALARQADRWRIGALTLRTYYQDGNLGLPALAGERAETAPRATTG